MNAVHMLSTIDNPYNPFSQYDEWYVWDQTAGYNTPSFLARVVRSSDELSEADQSLAYEQAIEEIVTYNVLGLYIKVAEPTDAQNEELTA
jgi:hypothetical protein